jgi:ABC-type dipeptide/oligopeptide/nickel transport system permease subunit
VTTLARVLERPAARVGCAIVGAFVLLAVVGPLVAPHDPYASDFVRGVSPLHTPVGPSRFFWLGADRLYRDEFARLAVGARFSLTVGVLATVLATAIGGAVGIVAGWYEGTEGARVPWVVVGGLSVAIACAVLGRPESAIAGLALGIAGGVVAATGRIDWLKRGPRIDVDTLLMRAVDIGLAFPFLLLVMAIGAAFDRTTGVTVVLVLGATGWLGTARVVRAKTMQVRSIEFVQAARALGCSTWGVLIRHVLPNVSGVLSVVAILSVAQMILAESVLGYLGVGVAPPTPTLGRMLLEGQDYYLAGPWLVIAPGAALVLAVLGLHLLGEGLRDGLDARG